MDALSTTAALVTILQGDAPPAETPGNPPAAAVAPLEARPLTLDLAADAWFPRLVGDLTRGGAAIDTRDIGLSDSEVAFAGELGVTVDRWRLAVSGFTFSTDGTAGAESAFQFGGINVAAGDSLATSADWWGVGLDLSYALWRPLDAKPFPWSEPGPAPANPGPDGRSRVDFAIDPAFGLSYYDFSQSLTDRTQGLSTDFSGQWLGVRFGADVAVDFHVKDLVGALDTLRLEVGATAGPTAPLSGGSGGWVVDLEAAFVLYATPNVAARLGYRYLDADLEADAGIASVSLQGLFAGVGITW
jgi:hypothetical protein